MLTISYNWLAFRLFDHVLLCRHYAPLTPHTRHSIPPLNHVRPQFRQEVSARRRAPRVRRRTQVSHIDGGKKKDLKQYKNSIQFTLHCVSSSGVLFSIKFWRRTRSVLSPIHKLIFSNLAVKFVQAVIQSFSIS